MNRQRGKDGFLQVGKIPALKQLAKKYKPPSRLELELVEAVATIREQPDATERHSGYCFN